MDNEKLNQILRLLTRYAARVNEIDSDLAAAIGVVAALLGGGR